MSQSRRESGTLTGLALEKFGVPTAGTPTRKLQQFFQAFNAGFSFCQMFFGFLQVRCFS